MIEPVFDSELFANKSSLITRGTGSLEDMLDGLPEVHAGLIS